MQEACAGEVKEECQCRKSQLDELRNSAGHSKVCHAPSALLECHSPSSHASALLGRQAGCLEAAGEGLRSSSLPPAAS